MGHGHHHHHDVHGGPPVLDIGGDIGAMVVTLDREALGSELFLRAEGDGAASVHTGVWERHVAEGHVTAALFPELREGAYWVLDGGGGDVCRVEVAGGRLTTLDLRHRS